MKATLRLCVLMLCVTAQQVLAADGDGAVRLCIANATGIHVTLDTPGERTPMTLAGQGGNYEARIAATETLDITVCDHNPLLFTYSVGELTKTALPDVAAGDQFAAVIQGLGKVLGSSQGLMMVSKGADAEKAARLECPAFQVDTVQGLGLKELSQQIETLVAFNKAIPGRIEMTHGPRNPEPRGNSDLEHMKRTVAAELADALKLKPSLAKLSDYSLARMTNRPITINYTLGDEQESHVLEQPNSVFTGDSCAEARKKLLNEQLGLLQFTALERATLADMLAVAEKFSAAFQGVGDDALVASIRFDAKNRQTQSVTLAANEAFAKFYQPSTKAFAGDAKKIGKATINVEPKLRLRMAIAPGVIYSFVKQPKFSAKAAGGAFTIAREESDYAAASGVVALNITQDKHMRENVRPFVQVGISPKKDEFAFLLGLGLALQDYNNAVISAGAIYQERPRLIEGLSVGSTIATAEDLKLDNEFKFGFYLAVSYNIAATK